MNRRIQYSGLLAAALLLLPFVTGIYAGQDHAEFIKGPFKDGQDVTRVCIECHDKQAGDFMQTTHWKWKGTPNHVKGMEKSAKEFGKTNMMNSFCTSVQGGENGMVREACGKCHAGYGWTRTEFDFSDKSRIDCLVCHAVKGNYARSATGCTIDMKSLEKGVMDLEVAAKSVGRPTIRNCGYCHFFGGGGDGVKHAGLDSTLEAADRKQDVHMATKAKGGQGLLCVDCHKAKDHRISGASSQMAHHDGRVLCEECHSGGKAPHKKSRNGKILDRHTATVACQTCHIPMFNKKQATKMSWNWSDTGKEKTADEQFDRETFDKRKGTFTWGMNVEPVYAWYNGQIERYMVGDRIRDPNKPVTITRPAGDIKDRNARIYPYKLYTGDQPMDESYGYLLIFQQYGSLWKDFDWEKAIRNGEKGSGLPYSGKFRFVATRAYISAAHEVSPKEDALQCGDCHQGGNRLDWKALGYKGDPMQSGGRTFNGAKGKGDKGRK